MVNDYCGVRIGVKKGTTLTKNGSMKLMFSPFGIRLREAGVDEDSTRIRRSQVDSDCIF